MDRVVVGGVPSRHPVGRRAPGRVRQRLESPGRLGCLWLLGLAAAPLACVVPPLESPEPKVSEEWRHQIKATTRTRADVLFLIDNSASMAPMSAELQRRFGSFLSVFDQLAVDGKHADLHIAVVTSDYGRDGSCVARGPGGRFVRVGAAAPPGCLGPVGDPFIRFSYDPKNPANNLPAGQDLATTFRCMASVVNDTINGCGLEYPLESVYAALAGGVAENGAFLRDDALLAVVFVTNEDDCSAASDADLLAPRDDRTGFRSSYRCTRYGLLCSGVAPPYGADAMGLRSGCIPAPNPGGGGPGKLHDVSRYVDRFTKTRAEGGLKDDPRDVILVGIDAKAGGPGEDTIEILLASNPDRGEPFKACSPFSDADGKPTCVPVLQRGCDRGGGFFGDPAVRLNAVVRAAPIHHVASICDDDYSGALGKVASLIKESLDAACIDRQLIDPSDPDCEVVETVAGAQHEIPRCDRAGGARPCWRLEPKAPCASTPSGVGLTIERDAQPPPGAEIGVACATRP